MCGDLELFNKAQDPSQEAVIVHFIIMFDIYFELVPGKISWIYEQWFHIFPGLYWHILFDIGKKLRTAQKHLKSVTPTGNHKLRQREFAGEDGANY